MCGGTGARDPHTNNKYVLLLMSRGPWGIKDGPEAHAEWNLGMETQLQSSH